MVKGFLVALLALVATASGRPEPQFIYNAVPYYGSALSAAYTAPSAAVAPVVPAAIPAPALPVPAAPGPYSGLYPYPSAVSAYSYGYQSTFPELPVVSSASANLLYNSPYTSLPYSSLPYTSLSYAPASYVDYLTAYRR